MVFKRLFGFGKSAPEAAEEAATDGLLRASDVKVDERFGVDDPRSIGLLLRRMVEQRSMLEAALPGGGPGLLTAILEVDERSNRLLFDASPHASVERIVLAQPQIAFSARVDRVDVRFATGPFRKVEFEGMAAYQAPLPTQMRYLQRREFFRIEVPPGHAAYCQLLVPARQDSPPRDIRTRVFDISGGGLSLFVPPGSDDVLTGGERFSGCRLTLPEHPPIQVNLRVRRNFRIGRKQAISQTCAGCEYLDLAPSAQIVIQRYLMRLDRERIARDKRE